MKVPLSDEVTETNQKRRNLKDWGRGEKRSCPRREIRQHGSGSYLIERAF